MSARPTRNMAVSTPDDSNNGSTKTPVFHIDPKLDSNGVSTEPPDPILACHARCAEPQIRPRATLTGCQLFRSLRYNSCTTKHRRQRF